MVPPTSAVPATQSAFFGYNLVPHVEQSRLAELVQLARSSGAWIVPTQTLFESMVGGLGPDDLRQWPEMRYWPSGTVAQWAQSTATTRQQLGFAAGQGEQMNLLRRRIMNALRQAGVPFLLGSDAPQWWNVPGFSLERELQAMVKAGFTPWQALESGSRNVARFFNAEDEFGTVAAGRRADLVLLDANPVEDIGNWSKRAGVMVRGKWIPREEIAERLDALSR
jgi:hypothetical protein